MIYRIALSRALNVESAEITKRHTPKKKKKHIKERHTKIQPTFWRCVEMPMKLEWLLAVYTHTHQDKNARNFLLYAPDKPNWTSPDLRSTLKIRFQYVLCIDIKLLLSLCNFRSCQKFHQFLSTNLQLKFSENKKTSNTVKALEQFNNNNTKKCWQKSTFYNFWFNLIRSK